MTNQNLFISLSNKRTIKTNTMEQKSERVLDAIESAMNLFNGYGMTNHLTEKELKMVLFELKQIANAGHNEAKSLLWNSSLKF